MPIDVRGGSATFGLLVSVAQVNLRFNVEPLASPDGECCRLQSLGDYKRVTQRAATWSSGPAARTEVRADLSTFWLADVRANQKERHHTHR
jgi:hypothetical protein